MSKCPECNSNNACYEWCGESKESLYEQLEKERQKVAMLKEALELDWPGDYGRTIKLHHSIVLQKLKEME